MLLHKKHCIKNLTVDHKVSTWVNSDKNDKNVNEIQIKYTFLKKRNESCRELQISVHQTAGFKVVSLE